MVLRKFGIQTSDSNGTQVPKGSPKLSTVPNNLNRKNSLVNSPQSLHKEFELIGHSIIIGNENNDDANTNSDTTTKTQKKVNARKSLDDYSMRTNSNFRKLTATKSSIQPILTTQTQNSDNKRERNISDRRSSNDSKEESCKKNDHKHANQHVRITRKNAVKSYTLKSYKNSTERQNSSVSSRLLEEHTNNEDYSYNENDNESILSKTSSELERQANTKRPPNVNFLNRQQTEGLSRAISSSGMKLGPSTNKSLKLDRLSSFENLTGQSHKMNIFKTNSSNFLIASAQELRLEASSDIVLSDTNSVDMKDVDPQIINGHNLQIMQEEHTDTSTTPIKKSKMKANSTLRDKLRKT